MFNATWRSEGLLVLGGSGNINMIRARSTSPRSWRFNQRKLVLLQLIPGADALEPIAQMEPPRFCFTPVRLGFEESAADDGREREGSRGDAPGARWRLFVGVIHVSLSRFRS
jgi:hypothetical protein